MIKLSRLAAIVAAVVTMQIWVAPAQAQATRTWVSGVGDDVNPCSRTAPCKTFAGAISKTAPGGEIDCLDPGGFGTVTITKSITIDGTGTFGSILASSTNGVNVNDGSSGFPNSIRVILRGISINGAGGGAQNAQGNPGTGLVGVNFISGASLTLIDVIITNFNSGTAAGVNFHPASAARLVIENSVIDNNGTGATGGGVVIQPTVTGATAVLNNVHLEGNANVGLLVNSSSIGAGGTVTVTATDSVFFGSTFGVDAISGASTGTANVTLTGNTISNNSVAGALANGATARIVIGGSTLGNNGTGLGAINSGFLGSFGDNYVNGTPGTPSAPAPTKI